jgi:hypothetical protein
MQVYPLLLPGAEDPREVIIRHALEADEQRRQERLARGEWTSTAEILREARNRLDVETLLDAYLHGERVPVRHPRKMFRRLLYGRG